MTGWLAGSLARRTPTSLLLLVALVVGLARLIGWLWRQPFALAGVLVAALVVWQPATAAVVAAGLVLALGVGASLWQWLAPDSWGRSVGLPVRSWWRRRYYARRWADAVHGCGLVRADVEPVLMSVRAGAGVDRLLVHVAPGSVVADWRDLAPRLASALEVRSVRVRTEGPRDVLLLVRHREVRRRDPVWPDQLDAEVAEVAEQERREADRRREVERELADRQPATVVPTEAPRPAFPRRPR